jgi:hypothetical protein
MRVTPFGLVGIAVIYSTILYMSIGDFITRWVAELSK